MNDTDYLDDWPDVGRGRPLFGTEWSDPQDPACPVPSSFFDYPRSERECFLANIHGGAG